MIKLRKFVYIYSDDKFIVKPPFTKNDGGGSYSGGDFNNLHHEFLKDWSKYRKVFTIKIFFVYL